MADSRCCFGCSNVCKGAWMIAIFDMVICISLTFKTLSMLNFMPYSSTYKKQQHSHFGDDTSSFDMRPNTMENDFNMFSQLFILFLFFYVNFNLKKATYVHNVQSIYQWLVTSSIFFIFLVLFIGFITLKYSSPVSLSIIWVGIPFCTVLIYQIYIVKHFYDDELKFLAASDRNTVPQPALGGTSYVTITNQSVQPTAAYPVQPPTAYPVQPGPYVIQRTCPPVTQTSPYPQQTHQYQPQVHQAHPPLEPYVPQEYCNPPPYSPAYNAQESSSTKQ